MMLKTINKATYRKHLNIVIACIIIALLVISLGSSSLLIYFIGDKDGANFVLNLSGVLFAAFTIAIVLYRTRELPFMSEVVYVWDLKQELNAIYRSSAKLKLALARNNYDALVISYFNLKGSIQLYELDDNNLTLDSLKNELASLDAQLQSLGLDISTDDYHRKLLKTFAENPK